MATTVVAKARSRRIVRGVGKGYRSPAGLNRKRIHAAGSRQAAADPFDVGGIPGMTGSAGEFTVLATGYAPGAAPFS